MSEASEDHHTVPAQKRTRPDPELGYKSAIIKRSIELHGHKTSVSLEDQFWDGLRFIAEVKRTPLPVLLQSIDAQRGYANMSSAIRVYVLEYYRNASATQATQAGRPAA
jgi:predicted DNA-binding ribbon-helix-helix protein